MLHLVQLAATFCCAIFAGAAIYINLVEHPARMSCGTHAAAMQWAPSYRRATFMQAPLAMLGFLCGAGAWLMGGSLLWLCGAMLIGLVVPITFILIMPTNHQLLDPQRDPSSIETGELLEKWGRLHAIRSVLSLTATGLFLTALI